MDFARVFVTIMLYLTFFTLLGSLFGIVQFPPPAVRYTLFSLPLGLGDIVIGLSLFDPYFLGLIIFVALVSIIVGAIPFVDLPTRFVTAVLVGSLLTISLGIMLDGAMIVIPTVFRIFFVWIPIFALGVSMFALIVGGRMPSG